MDVTWDFRRYLLWLVAVVIVGTCLAVALVVVVDPYRIYQLVDVPGFNHVKPAPERYLEEIKLTGARAAKADIFVMGNSRAEVGLDPASFPRSVGRNVPYNLAISGSAIATARDELEYLCGIGQQPKMVVLGVDFIDFLVNPSSMPTTVRLLPSEHKVDSLKWKFDAIFSLASVTDALMTLRIQRSADVQTASPDGFNPLLEYKKIAREEGYYAIFRQRAEENAKNYVRKPHALFEVQSGTSPALDDWRAIVALAAQRKIELHVLIYPYHAQILAMFEQAGLWPAFEQWKSILAQDVANVRQESPGAQITLWDFSGFSPLQCEPIPSKNDKASITQWYWEAGHFKSRLGDLVLNRLLEKNPIAFAQSDDFGFPLTPSNLQKNQERIARERSACLASAPQMFADATSLIDHARRDLH